MTSLDAILVVRLSRWAVILTMVLVDVLYFAVRLGILDCERALRLSRLVARNVAPRGLRVVHR